MKYLYTSILLIMMMLVGVGATQAQVDTIDTPEMVIMRYINALNMRDYATAYEMLLPVDQTYNEFVEGYEETLRIVPYFGRTGVGAGSIYINTILLGYQLDGTVMTFYGYYQLANGANFDPVVQGYVLSGGRFQLIQDGIAPSNDTIEALINAEWVDDLDFTPSIASVSEMSNISADAVLYYYDYINQGLFEYAYTQWLTPLNGGISRDFRRPYPQFVIGYADTAYVTVYTGAVQRVVGTMTHDFVPVVLVGLNTDGTFNAYSGCYAMGYVSAQVQGIINGRFTLLADNLPATATIFNTLDTIDCASLNIAVQ